MPRPLPSLRRPSPLRPTWDAPRRHAARGGSSESPLLKAHPAHPNPNIQTTPARARGVVSTGTEQVATIALCNMQGVFETPSNSRKPSHPKSTSCPHVGGQLSCPPHGGNHYHQCTQPTWEGTSQPSISYGEHPMPLFSLMMLTHFSFSPHSCGSQVPTYSSVPCLGPSFNTYT